MVNHNHIEQAYKDQIAPFLTSEIREALSKDKSLVLSVSRTILGIAREKNKEIKEVSEWYCERQHDCFVQAMQTIRDCQETVDKRGMIISGASFIGKTVIAREIFREACRAFDCHDPVLLNQTELKLMQGDQIKPFIAKAVKASVVMWDDFEASAVKTYGQNFDPFRIYLELNKAQRQKSFTIITTNLDMRKYVELLASEGDSESSSPVHMVNRIIREYSIYNMI